MLLVDVVVAALGAELVRLEQHLAVAEAGGRHEAVGRELDQQPERVGEVDRVHEAAVLDAAVVDAALVEADDGLVERRLGDRERDVVDGAGVGRGAGRVGRAGLVGEDRDQAPVAGVEVEVALGLAVEVGLLEHERHARGRPPRSRSRSGGRRPTSVMWWTPWVWSFFTSSASVVVVLDELRFVLAALQGAPRHEVDAGLHDEHGAQALADAVGEALVGVGVAGQLDADRQRGVLLDAVRARAHEDVSADVGREGADDFAHGAGEDVDAADDEHVVGAADAADARAGAAARARARLDAHVVAGAEAQERRGAVPEVGEDELAAGAVVEGDRPLRLGVDELGVDEAAGAEVHAVLVLALAPQRDADVADAHGLGDLRAPALLEGGAEGGLAAAGLAGDEDALDAGAREIGSSRSARPRRTA